MAGARSIATASPRSCCARLRGELSEHGRAADPELVRAMLVGPVAWPLLGATTVGPPPGAVAALVAATLKR